MTDLRSIFQGYVAVALLLPLASCLAPDSAKPVASAQAFGLRGALEDDSDIVTGSIAPAAPIKAPVQPDVPSMGPDEAVATDAIAGTLNKRPQFEIDMSFAPGDGATALKAALSDALSAMPPAGLDGNYRLRGTVTVSNSDTGDVNVRINWRVARADGVEIGSIDQQNEARPAEIAAYWGDFARSAAKPAAEGIYALLSTEARPKRNAS